MARALGHTDDVRIYQQIWEYGPVPLLDAYTMTKENADDVRELDDMSFIYKEVILFYFYICNFL